VLRDDDLAAVPGREVEAQRQEAWECALIVLSRIRDLKLEALVAIVHGLETH
jgi:hypothetical protein